MNLFVYRDEKFQRNSHVRESNVEVSCDHSKPFISTFTRSPVALFWNHIFIIFLHVNCWSLFKNRAARRINSREASTLIFSIRYSECALMLVSTTIVFLKVLYVKEVLYYLKDNFPDLLFTYISARYFRTNVITIIKMYRNNWTFIFQVLYHEIKSLNGLTLPISLLFHLITSL